MEVLMGAVCKLRDRVHIMLTAVPGVSLERSKTVDALELQVENLENELRVFFGSFVRGLEALENFEVRRNTFKFLDQYGTIADILKVGKWLMHSEPIRRRTCCPECLLTSIGETLSQSMRPTFYRWCYAYCVLLTLGH